MELSDLPPTPPTRPIDTSSVGAGTDPTTDDAPNEQLSNSRTGVWSISPRTVGLVVLASFVLFILIALGSAIDLPSIRGDSTAESARDQNESADAGGEGDRDRTPDIRPIPGCPDGFIVGDVWVVPDPEACGFEPLPPGSSEAAGQKILVPGAGGSFAGLRVNPDGSVEPVEIDDLRDDDIVLRLEPDGSYSLTYGDGRRIEVAPGPGGLDITEIPAPGSSGADGEADQGLIEGGDGGGATSDLQGADRDWSGLGTLLLILLAVAAVAAVVMGLRGGFQNKRKASSSGDFYVDERLQDDVDETPIYAAQIDALDQLLWEIDQETDPRQAILRVYGALETGLDNPEMTRRSFETPGVYIRRILGQFDALEAPLRELTSLFEQARFSDHEITVDMRNRAVAILVEVRHHYANVEHATFAMAGTAPGSHDPSQPPSAQPPSAVPPPVVPPSSAPPPPGEGWTAP